MAKACAASSMAHSPCLTSLLLLSIVNAVFAALPRVDFDRMGKVGLAGSFAGFDLFQNTTSALSFDPSTSTLLLRSSDGSLTRLGSTNSGGRISSGCAIDDIFYFAGSFSSIEGTPASNVASYSASSNSFTALGSGGPNGEIDAVFCDAKSSLLWVGGSFSSPGSSVAVWNTKARSWSRPPFAGVSGAGGRVFSITSNSSQSSLFFSGSFITSFGSVVLNNTHNPNVPFSAGATSFSSSLVPIPLQKAQIQGSPSTSDSRFGDIENILCPTGDDGPGNSWFGADGTNAMVTVRTFTFMSAHGVRLGNTFQANHGTTGFSVTTIPDNNVQTLSYVDPVTQENKTCTDPCPLSTDSSILYQDFLFANPLAITGVQIRLSQWTGAAPGLHILQLLSSGAFASALDEQNGVSCFAPNPSNTTRTGNWAVKVANTDIPGTTQSVFVSMIDVGTSAANGPTFTWMPYVSASGNYEINLLVPGCTNFQDCALRTSVKVTVFPGNGLPPSVTTISQTNTEDASTLIYRGPILPSSPNFVTTITMTLADNPDGQGQDGKWEIVADRVQLVLQSADVSASSNTSTASGQGLGSQRGFGFFEWPLSSSNSVDATKALPNTTKTALDEAGFQLLSSTGSTTPSASTFVASVAHHSSGNIYLGGNFNLSSGTASGSTNIVAFSNGVLSSLADKGLNGAVSVLALDGDKLIVGGSFSDLASGSSQGKIRNIALYDVSKNEWQAMRAGLNGPVSSIAIHSDRAQISGNFTKILDSATGTSGIDVGGFAVWDIKLGAWVNSGGFIVGSMSFVGNGPSTSQFVAGNVVTSRRFGASGMVMLQNGRDGLPSVTPLGMQLESTSGNSTSANNLKRRRVHSHLHLPRTTTWLSHMSITHLFARQSTSDLAPLPADPPAPAPAVLAGAFWTNTSTTREIALIGGNFSFVSSDGQTTTQSLAIYDIDAGIVSSLSGAPINGTIRALLVDSDRLYVGGRFTIQGETSNGFAVYDLSNRRWDSSGVQALQASSGAPVVRSITKSQSWANTIYIAGSFSQVGSLPCQAVCAFDTSSHQWNVLGEGIKGEASSVAYGGNNQEVLLAAGSIALQNGNTANVAQFSIANTTWSAVGTGLPGPITAIEVNDGNTSSIFAAGRSSDGGTSFLSFWNGVSWKLLDSTFQSNTTIGQLTMVPLQDTHSANDIIQPDRMLMVSGSLADSSFGNISSALYDGQTFIPYIVSTSPSGSSGVVASLFHSFSNFSFSQHKFLATGVVILISIAIAAGVVFLLALIGILWTLFSRRDDKLQKFEGNDVDDDDDSAQHRPSSLLEHINAATRTTILGAVPAASAEREEEKITPEPPAADQDPYGPDASNYVRADTPSDAVGGMLAEEKSRPAHARYSFDGTGEGELPMTAGVEVEVLDDKDPAWWYARDVRTGREGVVPAAYLY